MNIRINTLPPQELAPADRYQLTLDCRPMVRRFAETYQTGHYWRGEPEQNALLRKQVRHAWRHIPVAVQFTPEALGEPYASAEEMRERIASEKVFLVRKRESKSVTHWFDGGHAEFRAVHDWYGHVVCHNPFTMDGELGAFRAHVAEKLFTAETLPLVWSEVVLENAYRLFHGRWYWHSKPVFDEQWGKED